MNNKTKNEKKSRDFFAEILKSGKPLLVEVWADWSGDSFLMNSIVKKVEKRFSNDIDVIRVNLDDYKNFLGYYGIETAPAFILINKGEIIKVIREPLSQKRLEEIIIDRITK